MSLATNVIEFSERRKPEGAVIADTDNGYTRTANEIQDRLCQLDLTGAQFQVLNVIIRITYGYNQKTNRITNTYVAELTGLSEKAVRLALAELQRRNIILLEKSGLMKLVGINKVISDWVVTTGKSEKQAEKGKQSRSICSAGDGTTVPQARYNGSGERRYNGSEESEQRFLEDGKTVPLERNCSSSTKDNTKNNLLKTTNKRQKDSSVSAVKPDLDFSCWPSEPSESVFRDWKTMRTAKKAPVTQTVINRLAKQIELAFANGMTVDDVLAECVSRGWTGFEYAWLRRPGSSVQSRFPHEFHGQNYEGGAL
ncbi:hypothetical protein EIK76_00315 [Rheinheimera mesophila]|uniref:Bacteriophage lambda Replication protein O N-terminal domain-containing protein n=1 Tax=Rheinheimera mesophila TaxID=1547515 RepID=A0A3P3QNI6_9GAMM|nr:replication protein [Rheinheimera mesophila]RRJ22565.1 hypothetical protein EIK76_00315 [Rheinheimera mesophila]